MSIDIRPGDCLDVIKAIPDASIDSVVTDPPYALVSIIKRFGKEGAAPAKGDVYARAGRGFMGKQWDTGERAFAVEFWAEVLRVLKPGGHLVAFSGTRTYHRLACAIEDAGFEIRDQLQWLYGSGFPKSHDVSKGIDRHLGADRPVVGQETLSNDIRGRALLDAAHDGNRPSFTRDVTVSGSAEATIWEGWGTALKPACEPICLARKPLIGTGAVNVLTHGTGALNIDGCRIDAERTTGWAGSGSGTWNAKNCGLRQEGRPRPVDGRWPANVIHDGSDEVLAAFPSAPGQQGIVTGNEPSSPFACVYGDMPNRAGRAEPRGDSGSAARFFYSAKADSDDRFGSKHPTVKPIDLMAWLCRLITPPGGTVLDPFAGSGTTGIAAMREGFSAILIEREEEYLADIRARIEFYQGNAGHSVVVKNRNRKSDDLGPLFAKVAAE